MKVRKSDLTLPGNAERWLEETPSITQRRAGRRRWYCGRLLRLFQEEGWQEEVVLWEIIKIVSVLKPLTIFFFSEH